MNNLHVDVAIVGCGTAGMSAYRAASKYSNNVVTIEGGVYGTTCARVGCMPSKLLIAAAEAAHHIQSSAGFGVHAGSIKINGREVMHRVRSERDRFVGFVLESVEEFPQESKLKGRAKFHAPGILQLDDHTLIHAKSIVIATGSAPSLPPILSDVRERVIFNDQVFEWEDLPSSIAVFGPGIIGLELGQALHRLGVRTSVFGRGGRAGIFTDPKLVEYTRKTFQSEMDFIYDPQIKSVKASANGLRIEFVDDGGKLRFEEFEFALSATGRPPNLKNLCLENSGLELDEKGIPKYNPKTLQCGESPVFLAGDVSDHLPLLHEAADEGRIAGDNAGRYPEVVDGKRRSHLTVAFTDPQMVLVGSTFQDLQRQNLDFATGEVSFENQGRSRVMRVNKGLMNVYAHRDSHRFLGAEIFGPRAEHLGHLLAWAHQQKMTIDDMLDMVFYHPVIEEGLRTALRNCLQGLKR